MSLRVPVPYSITIKSIRIQGENVLQALSTTDTCCENMAIKRENPVSDDQIESIYPGKKPKSRIHDATQSPNSKSWTAEEKNLLLLREKKTAWK